MKKLITILSLFFSLAAAGQFGQAQLLKPTTQFLPEALNYIQRVEAAGRTLTMAEKTCINDNLIKPLISNGLWTKIHDAGPPIWGAAAPSVVSLKGVATLTVYGLPTYSNTGTDFNGASSFITNISPATALSLNSLHVGFYSRENTVGSTDVMIGSSTTTSGDQIAIVPRNTSNQIRWKVNQTGYVGTTTNTSTQGFYLANRSGSTATQMYKNGAASGTSTVASNTLPTSTITISGIQGSPGELPSGMYQGECAFWTVGASLTASEAATYFNIVESFLDCIGIGVVS